MAGDVTGDKDQAPEAPSERLSLFRYLTAENSGDYLAIMRLFSSTLLADLSAAEVVNLLREEGRNLDTDAVEERCRMLVRWGNLIRSLRDARVPTIADYRNSRARFQMSTLGGRVQRQVEDLFRATDGAREVAREVLGHTVGVLDRIHERLSGTAPDAEALAAEVTTVFNNQALFSESARDFYSYLGSVLTRYDLVGEEYATLKGLLLEYVELISNDVARHSPAIVERLARLDPLLPSLVDLLSALPGLEAGGGPVERLPGRSLSDWAQLSAWYTGSTGRSGPAQLRAAAEQALGQLITNAKRMLSAGGTGASRRADLLRLAALLATADAEQAERAFASAFGAYGMRHLSGGAEEPDTQVSPTTSWWHAPPIEVPLSLRERGDRTARGRSSRVPDPGTDRIWLTAQAEQEAGRLRAAVAELIAARTMHGAQVSEYAREVLLDYVGDFMARHQVLPPDEPVTMPFEDVGMSLVVTYSKGRNTVVRSPDGTCCVIHGLIVRVEQIAGQQASGGMS
ncbi:TIGR02677 family protein [Streptomyces sp. NPDC021212]|uniref:TIGR02677 family protein n=1 Tax=Streptomyces sp. NPDC021212 TaxID=3365118 RepID=UPI0037A2A226